MNPITALITVVLAAIGALLFLAGVPLAGIGFGIVAVLVALSLKMANNWERFVILRAGKLSSVKGPGLFAIIPVIDAITAIIDERIQTTQFNAEQVGDVERGALGVVHVPEDDGVDIDRHGVATGWRRRRCAK